MTEKLFQLNPYMKTCKAKVEKIEGNKVVLDRTIFAPEAGGQASDTGTIAGVRMIHAEESGGTVLHEVENLTAEIKEGAEVELTLDWDNRFDHMQNHLGEHILSGILFTEHGIPNKGFHLGSEFSTLDAGMKQMPPEMVADLELKANKVVYQALPVQIEMIESREEAEKLPLRKELKVDEDISVVTIPGVDCVACCCPHPADTSQVGIIKIIKAENYKGMTRIYFKCGLRALMDYRLKHDIVTTLNKKYSSEDETLLENIKIQENKLNNARRDLHTMKVRFAQIEAEALVKSAEDEAGPVKALFKEYEDYSLEDLKVLGKQVTELTDLPVIVSSLSSMTVILTHSGKSGFKCGQIVRDFASGFGGKGGGGDSLAQALFKDVEVMRNFIQIVKASV